MKFSVLLPAALLLSTPDCASAAALAQPATPDTQQKCDACRAESILRSVPTGSAFCSTLIYPPDGDNTKTKTTTTVTTAKTCTEVTKMKTVHGTSTVLEFSSITLPQVTITEYSSTYFITSGTPRPINKRNASPAVKDNSTPSALSTCARETISEACSSIVKPTTTTATITSTRFTCTTTTSLTTTIPNHEITATYPLTLSPPPIIILAPSTVTLTTTVPVDCVGPTYNSNASLGIGNTIVYAEYPYFPQTPVECCILCWSLPNCVASAFIPDALECEMLVQINGSEGVGVSSICPLGVEDYPFGFVDPDSNVLPGPCGM